MKCGNLASGCLIPSYGLPVQRCTSSRICLPFLSALCSAFYHHISYPKVKAMEVLTSHVHSSDTQVVCHLSKPVWSFSISELGVQCKGHLGCGIYIVGFCKPEGFTTAGTVEAESTQKKGYKLPRAPMTNSDLTRLINSDEVQSVVRPKKTVRLLPL